MDCNIFFTCFGIAVSYNNLRDFIKKIFEIIKNEKTELNKILINEYKQLKQFDFDDSKICEFNFLSETIYNYLAVIIYSFTEKSFREILLKDSNDKFQIKKLIKYFKEIYSLDIEALSNYQKFDELRLINNCIKHCGIVNKDLSKCNNKWKQGKEIILKENEIRDYFNNIVDFISDILFEISKNRSNLLHIE